MVRTTVYLPEALKHRVETYAATYGTTEAAVIRDALERLLSPDTDRSWVTELAGIGSASGPPIGDRIDEALADSGFGVPRP
ncbi:MAG: CopG family transcriptional regulator [Kineosporiaceae bacterium]